MEDKENTIYALEVLDKSDNWTPLMTSMDLSKLEQLQATFIKEGGDKDSIRITSSEIKFKGVYYQG